MLILSFRSPVLYSKPNTNIEKVQQWNASQGWGKLQKVSLTDMLVKLDDFKRIQFDGWPWPFESDISRDEYDDQ